MAVLIPNVKAECPDHGVRMFEWEADDNMWICQGCLDHVGSFENPVQLVVILMDHIQLNPDGEDYLWRQVTNGPMVGYEPAWSEGKP